MKKIIVSAVLLLGFVICSQAQKISQNALGIRIGDNSGFGGEISCQRKLAQKNRLEFDLGWRNRSNYYGEGVTDNAVKLTGLYQWIWNIDKGFNWYAGVGAGLGSWNHEYKNNYKENGSFAFVAGDIGVEYHFDIPLLVSLDFRPEFGGNTYYSNHYGSDIALGVRYLF